MDDDGNNSISKDEMLHFIKLVAGIDEENEDFNSVVENMTNSPQNTGKSLNETARSKYTKSGLKKYWINPG